MINMTGTEIVPKLFSTTGAIKKCLNGCSPSQFAGVGSETIEIFEFGNNGQLEKRMNTLFFKSVCNNFCSLPGSPFVWGYGIRNFEVINCIAGTSHVHSVSSDINETIFNTYALTVKKPKIVVNVVQCALPPQKETASGIADMIYDVEKDSFVNIVYGFRGFRFPLGDGTHLIEEFGRYPNPTLWTLLKNNKRVTNNLTKKLSDLDMVLWPGCINPKTHFILGESKRRTSLPSSAQRIFSIHWDKMYTAVSAERLMVQLPDNRRVLEYFELSPDGNWAKTIVREKGGSYRAVFYNINRCWPQSLSLPVMGGTSPLDAGGCFVQTKRWGTVYVDVPENQSKALIVYTMKDVLEKIKIKMAARPSRHFPICREKAEAMLHFR